MTRSRIERERPHRLDRDRLALLEVRQPRLARQARPAVDLGAARAALRGLAVPADGEVRRVVGLDPVERVEDDHPLLDRHVELGERALGRAAFRGRRGDGRRPSVSLLRPQPGCGARRASWAAASSRPPSPSTPSRTTLFFLPHFSSSSGKSSRLWAPRLSSRWRALRATASDAIEHVADLEDEVPAGVVGATARRRGCSASGRGSRRARGSPSSRSACGPEDPDLAPASPPGAPRGGGTGSRRRRRSRRTAPPARPAPPGPRPGRSTARRRGSSRTPPRRPRSAGRTRAGPTASCRRAGSRRASRRRPRPRRTAPRAVVAPVSASTRMPPMM